jgi:methionine synthase II (cobalamin-independent)
MKGIEFACRATIIGTVPLSDPVEACNLVNRYLKDIPAWPQLPRRSFLENMYVQFSEGFPGVVIEGLEEGAAPASQRIFVDRSRDASKALEALYVAYLENKPNEFAIGREYAAGLYQFLSLDMASLLAVKGHVTGPVSWGLTVTDQDRKSIIYDDTLADAAAKMLRMKAAWQENELRRLSKNTIMFIDEPYMSSYGSAFFSVSKEKVVGLIREVASGISGLKGIHCCGNTDWSILLATGVDIINFDAYNYAASLPLYVAEVGHFLANSGAIAWGIVPTFEEPLASETVASLKDRLEDAMAPFARNTGISFRQLVRQSLLTPSCGLATLRGAEAAERALELLNGLSDVMRRKYS